jgi:hypothetical protein
MRSGDDFLPFSEGLSTVIPQPTPLVFVGHGIVAPEFDHNDYGELDVRGKIVVFLSGEPPSDDPAYFAGVRPTVYATPEAKRRTAISRGARGSLLVPSGREPAWKDWAYWRAQFAFEHVSLAYNVPQEVSALMRPASAARLFCGARHDLAEVYALEKAGRLSGFPLTTSVSYRGAFRERDFRSNNVAGLVPGRDRRLDDEYVLLSAHYDHLGIGPPQNGDAIYNGVIDNAIGVAGVLEIARALAQGSEGPRRSVIVLLTTGEEHGLLGSSYYTDHPLRPLYKTVANINVDGLAHMDTFNDVIGVGAELSTLGSTLERVARRLRLSVAEPPAAAAVTDAFAYSDQVAFAEAGVPAVLINEGFRWAHAPEGEALRRRVAWGRTRYHRPSDDLAQPLDFEATRQHAEVVLAFLLEVAGSEEAPRWRPGTAYALAQLRLQAEKR